MKYKILLWVVLILFGIFWVIAESAFQAFGIPEWGAKAILVVLLVLILGWVFKSTLVNAMPDKCDIFSANITDYPWHDEQTLKNWTTELLNIGFVYVSDFTLRSDKQMLYKCFVRQLFHPAQKCYAEICQFKQGIMKPTPMSCAIESYLEDDWCLTTTNKIPEGARWLIRIPKGIWQSKPQMSPNQLFNSHLEERNRIVTDLGVSVKPQLSEQDYYNGMNNQLLEQKSMIRKKLLLVIFAELLFFSIHPKYEWKGKYTEVAKARLTR